MQLDREQIIKEIKAGEKRHRKVNGDSRTFWNNFHIKLPGGWYETRFLPDPDFGKDYPMKTDSEFNSELFKSQTLGQFLDTINQTIIEVGGEELRNKFLSLGKIIDDETPIRPSEFQAKMKRQEKAKEERLELFKPVYVQLILKGYSKQDITG